MDGIIQDPGSATPNAPTSLIAPTAAPAPAGTPAPAAPAAAPTSLIQPPAPPIPEGGAADPAPGAIPPLPGTPADWREVLPEPFRENPLVTKYSDMNGLMEGFKGLASLAGKKGLVMPDGSDEQALSDYHAARGRPAQPSMYEWESAMADDGMTPIVNVDQEQLTAIRQQMHDNGVPGDLFPKIMDMWADEKHASAIAEQEAAQIKATTEIAALQEEWGGNFDTNTQRVNAFLQRNNLSNDLIELGLANSSKVMKAIYGLMENTGTGQKFDPVDPVTNSSYESQLDKVRTSKAYQDPSHPGHHDALAKFDSLFAHKTGDR